jgi:hypothetical protein
MKSIVLLLMLAAAPTLLAAQSESAKEPPNCEGKLGEEQLNTARAIEDFWQDFQSSLRKNNKQHLAAMAKYPMNANLARGSLKVRTPQEFVRRYDEILPEELRQMLLKQPVNCIGRVGWRGFTVAEGQIWFDQYPDGKVKIMAVNVVVYDHH